MRYIAKPINVELKLQKLYHLVKMLDIREAEHMTRHPGIEIKLKFVSSVHLVIT